MAAYYEVRYGVAAGFHDFTSDNSITHHATCCHIPQEHKHIYKTPLGTRSQQDDALREAGLLRDHRGLQALGQGRRREVAVPRRLHARGRSLGHLVQEGQGRHQVWSPESC